MTTESDKLFDILRRHAAQQPDAIASRSPRRIVTYRKFWSRIERATARLICEWQVQPGEIVAYWGCGHQDALMLYIAVARCGARLLPLEHAVLRADAHDFLRKHPAKVLLHDDEMTDYASVPAGTVSDLSSLIATRCHHHPAVREDDAQPSLITLARADNGTLTCDERSLADVQASGGSPASPFEVSGSLFDAAVLDRRVLPVLTARGTIVFR